MTATFEPCLLYLGTEDGIRTVRASEAGPEVVTEGLDGNAVRAIDVSPENPDDVFVGCGLRGWGLHRTADGGRTFHSIGFDEEWVWGVCRHPSNPATVYVGTEPPMLYRSTDDGETFRALECITDVPSRDDWTFFHEPFYAGHVHGIAIHPDRPERIFAGVEHGAVVYSTDGGATWEETLVGSDVHRVAFHPDDPDQVFVATGAGLYRSNDGGENWTSVPDLRGKYLHAIVFGTSDGSDSSATGRMYVYADRDRSPVYRSDGGGERDAVPRASSDSHSDGGESWEPVGEGLPAASPADTLRLHPENPNVVFYLGDTADGRSQLFVSDDAGESWQELGESFPKVWRLETVPDP